MLRVRLSVPSRRDIRWEFRARAAYGTALTLVLERMHPCTAGLPSPGTLGPGPVQVPKSWLKSAQSLTRRVSRNGNRGAGRRLGRRA